jgi:alkanesulfonate monooxygenase SsuD/methylene tetrahydromethanopterin reductase-like flavin-dependent oxidoreductase (luciferase family)
VALYGTDDGGGLGALGVGTPDQAAARLEHQAAAYARPGRPVLPVMEMIVTVADPTPGPGGCYSHPIADGDVDRYLAAARAHRQMLVLDVQPGQCPFLPQVQRWQRFLTQPDVGLALDAEWRMPRGVVPGTQIGTVSAGEVNEVVTWLAGLTRRGDLPQKPLVLHQFTPDMITDRARVLTPPELAVIAHTDGFGTTGTKVRKYAELADPRMHPGFKVFYRQDVGVMDPAQVLALAPAPDYISYQ